MKLDFASQDSTAPDQPILIAPEKLFLAAAARERVDLCFSEVKDQPSLRAVGFHRNGILFMTTIIGLN